MKFNFWTHWNQIEFGFCLGRYYTIFYGYRFAVHVYFLFWTIQITVGG